MLDDQLPGVLTKTTEQRKTARYHAAFRCWSPIADNGDRIPTTESSNNGVQQRILGKYVSSQAHMRSVSVVPFFPLLSEVGGSSSLVADGE